MYPLTASFICLSSAPNLRCESLPSIQSGVLIIPPTLEFIFALSLVFVKWRSGRNHLLLVAESWTYFSLALLDMLSHIIPTARTSLTIFKSLDIVIASLSFIPLLLYMLHLFLFFSSGKFVSNLPQQYRPATKYMIVIFIPLVVAFNEIGSFIGISHHIVAGSILAIGFRIRTDKTLWTIFSFVTIGLLTLYQAIHFTLAFYQLICVFVNKRRIKLKQSDEAHLLHGLGWVAVGLKLGTIESAVGFAAAGFGGAILRRILRFLGRACLLIGAVKGMDTIEDFRNLHDELGGKPYSGGFHRSKIKRLISNPRNSTFRRISPSEMTFKQTPHAPFISRSSPSIVTFNPRSPAAPSPVLPSPAEYQSAYYRSSSCTSSPGYPTSGNSSSIAYQSPGAQSTIQTPGMRPQRVTVNYRHGRAPTLEMRFSALDIPSASVFTESVEFRYPSGASTRLSLTSAFPSVASTYLQNPPKAMSMPWLHRSRNTVDNIGRAERQSYRRSHSYIPHTKAKSADSFASNSLDVVRNLAFQFPGPPTRVIGKFGGSVLEDHYSEDVNVVSRGTNTKAYKSEHSLMSTTHTLSRGNSLVKRKPVPPIGELDSSAGASTDNRVASRNDSVRTEAGHEIGVSNLRDDGTIASSPYTQVSSSHGFRSRREAFMVVPATEGRNSFTSGDDAPISSKSQTFDGSEFDNGSGVSIRSAEWLATASKGQRTKAVDIEVYRNGGQTLSDVQAERHGSEKREGLNETPWPIDTDVVEAEKEMWNNKGLVRVKSVGTAPRKTTPTPTRSELSGASIALERAEFEAIIKRVKEDARHYSDTLGYVV